MAESLSFGGRTRGTPNESKEVAHLKWPLFHRSFCGNSYASTVNLSMAESWFTRYLALLLAYLRGWGGTRRGGRGRSWRGGEVSNVVGCVTGCVRVRSSGEAMGDERAGGVVHCRRVAGAAWA